MPSLTSLDNLSSPLMYSALCRSLRIHASPVVRSVSIELVRECWLTGREVRLQGGRVVLPQPSLGCSPVGWVPTTLVSTGQELGVEQSQHRPSLGACS